MRKEAGSSRGLVSMTPLAGSGDTRIPPPQEGDPLMSFEQLSTRSLFEEATASVGVCPAACARTKWPSRSSEAATMVGRSIER